MGQAREPGRGRAARLSRALVGGALEGRRPAPQGFHSERLRYSPLGPESLDAFHHLVQDGHVRRYMMDGRVLSREWSAERTRDSQALFEQRGVGIWLARARRDDELVGFCGFARLPSLPEPQLLYAMLERFAGRGLATEMARACIAQARAQPGFDAILADVDAVNTASVRVLQKLGFERIAVTQGAFGDLFVFRLGPRPGSAEPSDQGIRWGASSTRRPSAADT